MTKIYSHQALPAGTMVQEYRIIRVLGMGSFGIVYTAENKFFAETVAIKEFLPSDLASRKEGTRVVPLSSETEEGYSWALQKFLEEARILRELANPEPHKNIVRVQQFIEANNTAYMVMDYEEGRPLSQILEERGILPEKELKSYLWPLLDGLDRVHSASVWHRDIKPSNILIRSDNSPVLIDFGAAHREIVGGSQSMWAIFSPDYAAPEQVSPVGKQGPWTDVYALGATLYRAVTGSEPTNASGRLYGNKSYTPAASAAKGSYTSTFLSAIDASLELNTEKRPQSVTEWRRRLELENGHVPWYKQWYKSFKAFIHQLMLLPQKLVPPGSWLKRLTVFALCVTVAVTGYFLYKSQTGFGALIVTINPSEAIRAGAQWKIDEGPWQSSGAKISIKKNGQHLVKYRDIDGWNSPEDENVQISTGEETNVVATYDKKPLSYLSVLIIPNQAVQEGAQWRIDEEPWQRSGHKIPLLKDGSHKVRFKNLVNWKTPYEKPIEVRPGKDIKIKGVYEYIDMLSPGNFMAFYETGGALAGILKEGVTLTSKDSYYLIFNPNQKSYAYIVQIDSSGVITPVFPNKDFSSKNNPLRPNLKYRFPEEKYFFLDENTGKERIYLIASKNRINELEEIYKKLKSADNLKKMQLARNFKDIFNRQHPGNVKSLWFWHKP